MRDLVEVLSRAGVDSPEAEAFELLRAVLGLPRAEVFSTDVAKARAARVLALAARRAEGVPLQYLTGVAPFRHLELRVGPGVLVPRPETEVLVERALAHLGDRAVCADVGTGSGAIALAIADECRGAKVFATEASARALRWARLNREELGLHVTIVEGDLLDCLPEELRGTIDVVVSNPPYVATGEHNLLPREVVEHEPHEALFAGEEGLSVIERLVEESAVWLKSGGWLVFEIAPRQSDRVRELLGDAGYGDVSIASDLTGRPRVAEAHT